MLTFADIYLAVTNKWLLRHGLEPLLEHAATQERSPNLSTGEMDTPDVRPAPAAAPIWTNEHRIVYKRGEMFCDCLLESDAEFIADRLNSFDVILTERNSFQSFYLRSLEKNETEPNPASTMKG